MGSSVSFPPLSVATRDGDLDEVQTLINSGASVNIKDADNWTPLHWAVANCSVSMVECLIRAGEVEAGRMESEPCMIPPQPVL